jgi:glucokinase
MTASEIQPPMIGVDLGATNMLFGVVDDTGSVAARHHRPTQRTTGAEGVISTVVQGVRDTLRQAGLEIASCDGVGLAVAGAVDAERGTVLNGFNLNWHDVPLRERVQSELGVPVAVDNDVNAAVWGEYCCGAGRGSTDCFGVWIGSGVGGGVVINSALYHGAFSTAGEFGLTISEPDGPPGARTVEDLGGRIGMQRRLVEALADHPDSMLASLIAAGPEHIATDALADAYERDDRLACAVINRGADRIGVAIANFVTMLSVDTVILGGGLIEAFGEPYLARIRDQFTRDVFPERCRACRLIRTELEGDAGIIGAAMLARARQ